MDNNGVNVPSTNRSEARNNDVQDQAVSSSLEEEARNKLADGLLQIYQPALEQTQAQLNFIKQRQSGIMDQFYTESQKILDLENNRDLFVVLNTVQVFHDRLQVITKGMDTLNERSNKLKRRATQLQQHCEQEQNYRAQQRELALQREQDLIAKRSHISSTTSPTTG